MAWQDALRFLCKEPSKQGQAEWRIADLSSAACPLYYVCVEADVGVHTVDWQEEAGSRCLYRCQGSQQYRRYMFRKRKFCHRWLPSWMTPPIPSFYPTTYIYSSICWIIQSFRCLFGLLTVCLEARKSWSVYFVDRWPFVYWENKSNSDDSMC